MTERLIGFFDVRTEQEVTVLVDTNTEQPILTHGEARWHTHHKSTFTDPKTMEPRFRPPIDLDTDLRLNFKREQIQFVPLYALSISLQELSPTRGASDFYNILLDRCVELGDILRRVRFKITKDMIRDIDSRWLRAKYEQNNVVSGDQNIWVKYTLTRTRAELQDVIVSVKSTLGVNSLGSDNLTADDRDLFMNFFKDVIAPLPPRLDCFGRVTPPETSLINALGYNGTQRGRYYVDNTFNYGRSASIVNNNQNEYNLRPDIGMDKDPVNNAGIAGDRYVCCGMSLEHPGCNIDTYSMDNDKSEPYVISQDLSPYELISIMYSRKANATRKEVTDSLSIMWRDSYKRGTAFLMAETYDRWHTEIQSIMDELARPIANALFTIWQTPSASRSAYIQLGPYNLNKLVGLYLMVGEYNRWRCHGKSLDLPQSPTEWLNYFDRIVFHPEDAYTAKGLYIGRILGKMFYISDTGEDGLKMLKVPFTPDGELQNITVFRKVDTSVIGRRGDGVGPPGTIIPFSNLPPTPAIDESIQVWSEWLKQLEESVMAGDIINKQQLIDIVRRAREVHTTRTEVVEIVRNSQQNGILAYVPLPNLISRVSDIQIGEIVEKEPQTFALIEEMRNPQSEGSKLLRSVELETSDALGDTRASMLSSRNIVISTLADPLTTYVNGRAIARESIATINNRNVLVRLYNASPVQLLWPSDNVPNTARTLSNITLEWAFTLERRGKLDPLSPIRKKQEKADAINQKRRESAFSDQEKRNLQAEAAERRVRQKAEEQERVVAEEELRRAEILAKQVAEKLELDALRKQQLLEAQRKTTEEQQAIEDGRAAFDKSMQLTKIIENARKFQLDETAKDINRVGTASNEEIQSNNASLLIFKQESDRADDTSSTLDLSIQNASGSEVVVDFSRATTIQEEYTQKSADCFNKGKAAFERGLKDATQLSSNLEQVSILFTRKFENSSIFDDYRGDIKSSANSIQRLIGEVKSMTETIGTSTAFFTVVNHISKLEHRIWVKDENTVEWTSTTSKGFSLVGINEAGLSKQQYLIGEQDTGKSIRVASDYVINRLLSAANRYQAFKSNTFAMVNIMKNVIESDSNDPLKVAYSLGSIKGLVTAMFRRLDVLKNAYTGKGILNIGQVGELNALCKDLYLLEGTQRAIFERENAITKTDVAGDTEDDVTVDVPGAVNTLSLQKIILGLSTVDEIAQYNATSEKYTSIATDGNTKIAEQEKALQSITSSGLAGDEIDANVVGSAPLTKIREIVDVNWVKNADELTSTGVSSVEKDISFYKDEMAQALSIFRQDLDAAIQTATTTPNLKVDSTILSVLQRLSEASKSLKVDEALLNIFPLLFGLETLSGSMSQIEFFRIVTSQGTDVKFISIIDNAKGGTTPPILLKDSYDSAVFGSKKFESTLPLNYYTFMYDNSKITGTAGYGVLGNIFLSYVDEKKTKRKTFEGMVTQLAESGTVGTIGYFAALAETIAFYSGTAASGIQLSEAEQKLSDGLVLYGDLQLLNAKRTIFVSRVDEYFTGAFTDEDVTPLPDPSIPSTDELREAAGVGAGGEWDTTRFTMLQRCRYILSRLDESPDTGLEIPADFSPENPQTIETLQLWTSDGEFDYELLNTECIRPIAELLVNLQSGSIKNAESLVISDNLFLATFNKSQYELLFKGEGNPSEIYGDDGTLLKGGKGGVPANQIILAQRSKRSSGQPYVLVTGWSASKPSITMKKGLSLTQARTLRFGDADSTIISNVGRLWANFITVVMAITRLEVAAQPTPDLMYNEKPVIGRAVLAIKRSLVSGKTVHGTWKGSRSAWGGTNRNNDPVYIESQQIHEQMNNIEDTLIAAENESAIRIIGENGSKDDITRLSLSKKLRRKATALASVEKSQFYARFGSNNNVEKLYIDGSIQINLIEPVVDGYRFAMIYLGEKTILKELPPHMKGADSSSSSVLSKIGDEQLISIGSRAFAGTVGAKEQANIGILLRKARLNIVSKSMEEDTVLSDGLSITNRGGGDYYIGDTPVVPDQVELLHRWSELAGILADILEDKGIQETAVLEISKPWRTTSLDTISNVVDPDVDSESILDTIIVSSDDDDEDDDAILLNGGDDDDDEGDTVDMESEYTGESLLSSIGSWMGEWPGTTSKNTDNSNNDGDEKWPEV